jgi:hypothetical protein
LEIFSNHELIKDLVGQKIYYYPISEAKTLTVGIYNEAIKKVFDNPIIIDALVDAQYQIDTKIGKYGVDQQYKLELFVQYRDIVEKGINVQIGDFFSFNDVFYEITEEQVMRNIYGLPEHKDGVKIVGLKAREEQFKALLMGPTDISRPEGVGTNRLNNLLQRRRENFSKSDPRAGRGNKTITRVQVHEAKTETERHLWPDLTW